MSEFLFTVRSSPIAWFSECHSSPDQCGIFLVLGLAGSSDTFRQWIAAGCQAKGGPFALSWIQGRQISKAKIFSGKCETFFPAVFASVYLVSANCSAGGVSLAWSCSSVLQFSARNVLHDL